MCIRDRKLTKSLADDILHGINEISLKDISERDRYTAEISLNLLKHAISLQISNITLASQSRSELENILSEDHETLSLLDLRTRLTISSTSESLDNSLQSVRLFIEECNDPLKRIGMIHAAFTAVKKILKSDATLIDYRVESITKGSDATAEIVTIINDGHLMKQGRSVSTDVVQGSVESFLNALNK